MSVNISIRGENRFPVNPEIPWGGAVAFPQAIAFFDLDRTLFVGHTLSLCVHHFMKKRRYHLTEYLGLGMISGVIPLVFQTLRISDEVKHKILTMEVPLAQELSETWFYEHLEPAISPIARERLQEHQDRGEQVVLLTASTQFIASVVSNKFGIKYCCTQLQEIKGNISCATVGPVCYGKDKYSYAQQIAGSWKVPLAKCSFYTDSYSDHSLLDRVGFPVAVNPDRKLNKEAMKRGWEVLLWN
jgi:HAD superfamily hydrolase (TIGR01490 family)